MSDSSLGPDVPRQNVSSPNVHTVGVRLPKNPDSATDSLQIHGKEPHLPSYSSDVQNGVPPVSLDISPTKENRDSCESSELSDLGEDESEAETDKMDFLDDDSNPGQGEKVSDLRRISHLTELAHLQGVDSDDSDDSNDSINLHSPLPRKNSVSVPSQDAVDSTIFESFRTDISDSEETDALKRPRTLEEADLIQEPSKKPCISQVEPTDSNLTHLTLGTAKFEYSPILGALDVPESLDTEIRLADVMTLNGTTQLADINSPDMATDGSAREYSKEISDSQDTAAQDISKLNGHDSSSLADNDQLDAENGREDILQNGTNGSKLISVSKEEDFKEPKLENLEQVEAEEAPEDLSEALIGSEHSNVENTRKSVQEPSDIATVDPGVEIENDVHNSNALESSDQAETPNVTADGEKDETTHIKAVQDAANGDSEAEEQNSDESEQPEDEREKEKREELKKELDGELEEKPEEELEEDLEEEHEEEPEEVEEPEDDDEVEADSDMEGDEVDLDIDEHRKLAISELISIENDFSYLRDKLYNDKLSLLEHEMELCLDGSHPELLQIYYKVNEFYQQNIKISNSTLNYSLKCINTETMATRTGIHQDFMKKLTDMKNDMVAETTSLWYKINRERNYLDQIVPDYNFAALPQLNLEALNMAIVAGGSSMEYYQEAAPVSKKTMNQNTIIELVLRRNDLNEQLGVLNSLKEFHGIPCAVAKSLVDEDVCSVEEILLRKASPEEVNEDLQAMGIY